jgi:CDP-glucose 4,6-dehydratase
VESLVTQTQFWSGRRVFVTGHTGFKGGWLVAWLRRLGAEVTGYALPPPTKPSLFEKARIGEGITSVIADVDCLDTLCSAVRDAAPEIVLHLAAQPLVHAGYSDPVSTYRTNVLGTVHLLEAVRRASGVRAVVNVTTDKCYENREWFWGYRENDALGGFDPYSNSKACSELVTASYRSAFFGANSGVAVASARAGNVIGGGDWGQDRLVPDLIRAFSSGKAANIRRPDAIRPWQHVLEPLSGYMLLAQRLFEHGAEAAQAWNFGPREEDARPVRWVAQSLAQAWGKNAQWTVDKQAHPHEAHYLKLDCSKARAELGWSPRLALPTAIEWTVRWHREVENGADACAVCERQIDDFEKLLSL